jgi:hypothetical protein
LGLRFDGGMPALTRRRSPDAREECWHIYYGDVHAGTIAIRTGSPHDEDAWGWNCGFYPGSHPGECTNGTAATFDQARADFEQAWQVFLSNRTEADFRACRDERDWTARKYAMWKAGEKLPSQKPSSLMRCQCGETFDSHDPDGSFIHRGHIYAAQATDGIRR